MTTTTPQAEQAEKTVYDWTGMEDDCPRDIVVLTGKRPLIIQAEAHSEARKDRPRIEQGDRRQGKYYVGLIGTEVGTGLQRLVDVAQGNKGAERIIELEKTRQIRTGDRAPDWVVEARKRAAEGHDPETSDNIHDAMTRLSIAARNW